MFLKLMYLLIWLSVCAVLTFGASVLISEYGGYAANERFLRGILAFVSLAAVFGGGYVIVYPDDEKVHEET